MNLNKIHAAVNDVPVLSEKDRTIINQEAEAVIKLIENEPKSGKWKVRAKTGTAIFGRTKSQIGNDWRNMHE